jgi:CDP-glucose 4,6-dehydratase
VVNRSFWKNKKVFVTGHTGFKGGWFVTWLLEMGAQVTGFALEPDTQPSYFHLCQIAEHIQSVIGDIRDLETLQAVIKRDQPEIVFHLAAQAIVRRSYHIPVETFETNLMGTVHLLEAIRKTPSVRAVVVVTSDKCYENRGLVEGYREEDPLGGDDPYSASKGCAELATAAYRRSFFEGRKGEDEGSVFVATARAGNVIGGGDWGEDRLIPDAMRTLPYGKPCVIRNPDSVRPWQHVLEPVHGYLALAEQLYQSGQKWATAWNFGPQALDSVPVSDLMKKVIQHWGSGTIQVISDPNAVSEAPMLRLDSQKARQGLGWRCYWSLDEAVQMTIHWYRDVLLGSSTSQGIALSIAQIKCYEAKLKEG